MSDSINHPSHYNTGNIEVIDAIDDWNLSFCLGNVVKYIARAGHKGDRVEDLKKAAWYLRHEIIQLGGSVGDIGMTAGRVPHPTNPNCHIIEHEGMKCG